jgi:hypothetical protein
MDNWSSNQHGAFRLLTAKFNLPLRQIEEFRVQMRRRTKIEIRSISMQRGQKTSFDVRKCRTSRAG